MGCEAVARDGRGDPMLPVVSVCLASFNTRDLLRECLRSIVSALPLEVIVVDNASGDGSADMVSLEFPAVHLVRHAENRGFAAAANVALRLARGRVVVLLNPDTVLPADGIDRLVDFLERQPGAGICGPALVYPDGRFQCCGYRLPTFWTEVREMIGERIFRGPLRDRDRRRRERPASVDWVCGACLVFRREVIDGVGLFDEQFFLYGEELDWCARARAAGWTVWGVPSVEVVHHLGQSAVAVRAWANAHLVRTRLQFHGKHRGWLYSRLVGLLYLARSVARVLSGRSGARLEVRAILEWIVGGGRPARP